MLKLSHSTLQSILGNPMDYYIGTICGIYPKTTKTAFAVGSAVHWGLEHNTDDLTEYWKQNASLGQIEAGYTRDMLLAESMVNGYLKHKDTLWEPILDDGEGGKLEIKEELHEMFLTAKLPSNLFSESYNFVGIVDLLLLTNKGFIVIDYKTSTYTPHWEDYLEQIYRYYFLLQNICPEVPVYKAGIINLKKSGIRMKQNENEFSFRNRLKLEYELNEDDLLSTHMFMKEDLDLDMMNDYINNLSKQADLAQTIVDNNLWYTNYGAVNGTYKSVYWDLYHHTPECWNLYEISDTIWNEDEGQFDKRRDCVDIDMQVIAKKNLMNKYDKFEIFATLKSQQDNITDKSQLFSKIKEEYITNDELLEKYWQTFLQKSKRK